LKSFAKRYWYPSLIPKLLQQAIWFQCLIVILGAVAVQGDTIVVGAFKDEQNGNGSGSVYCVCSQRQYLVVKIKASAQ